MAFSILWLHFVLWIKSWLWPKEFVSIVIEQLNIVSQPLIATYLVCGPVYHTVRSCHYIAYLEIWITSRIISLKPAAALIFVNLCLSSSIGRSTDFCLLPINLSISSPAFCYHSFLRFPTLSTVPSFSSLLLWRSIFVCQVPVQNFPVLWFECCWFFYQRWLQIRLPWTWIGEYWNWGARTMIMWCLAPTIWCYLKLLLTSD